MTFTLNDTDNYQTLASGPYTVETTPEPQVGWATTMREPQRLPSARNMRRLMKKAKAKQQKRWKL